MGQQLQAILLKGRKKSLRTSDSSMGTLAYAEIECIDEGTVPNTRKLNSELRDCEDDHVLRMMTNLKVTVLVTATSPTSKIKPFSV